MQRPIQVLILESEPSVLQIYKRVLQAIAGSSDTTSFHFKVAKNYGSALVLMDWLKQLGRVDLALLNLSMTTSENGKTVFTEDLASLLRQGFPEMKLMLFTSSISSFKVSLLFETMDPDSLIIHDDVDFKELVVAVNAVLNSTPYYSKSVLCEIRKSFSNGVYLDYTDKLILYHLSKGVKTKDLPGLVNLSKGGVERRKRNLKDRFNIDKGGDKLLLEKAREQGFI